MRAPVRRRGRRALPPSSWLPVWAGTAAVLVLTLLYVLLAVAGTALWSLPAGLVLARTATRVGCVLAIGFLFASAFLLPAGPSRAAAGPGHAARWPQTTDRLRTAAARGTGLWLAGASAELALRYAETARAGAAPALNDAAQIGVFLLGDRQGAAYFAQWLLTLGLAVAVTRVRTTVGAGRALAVGLLAAVALALTGHAAVAAPDTLVHLISHVLGAVAWTAGLVGMIYTAWLLRDDDVAATPLVPALGYYADLALASAVVVGLSGTTLALQVLQDGATPFSLYGTLLILKTVGWVVLVGVGAVNRLITLNKIRDGRPFPLIAFGTAEITVMLLVFTLAVVLGQTAPG